MIDADLTLSEELLGLLKNEAQSLSQHNYDTLRNITEKKQPLIEQLERHANLRNQWLKSLYKVADTSNWVRLLKSLETPDIEKRWQLFSTQIEKCRHMNNSNGLLINRGQNTCSQLLRLLKGGEKTSELYTPKGNKQSTSIYTTVAKA